MIKNLDQRKCKGCNTTLMFVKTAEGRMMPLDLQATVYEIKKDLFGEDVCTPIHGVYVSHFKTCPQASKFSQGKWP